MVDWLAYLWIREIGSMEYAKSWARSYGDEWCVIRNLKRTLYDYEPMEMSAALQGQAEGWWKIVWVPKWLR